MITETDKPVSAKGVPLITHEQLRTLLEFDSDEGTFKWALTSRAHGKRQLGRIAGRYNQGYYVLCLFGRMYKGHRLAWFYVHGEWPQGEIDHIDGNPSNNRISNLRVVTRTENSQNVQRAMTTNKVGFLGVHSVRGRFAAKIVHNKKQFWLGIYDTPEQAHSVYVSAKREMHKGNTL